MNYIKILDEMVFDKSSIGFLGFRELQDYFESVGDTAKARRAQEVYFENSYVNPCKNLCTYLGGEKTGYRHATLKQITKKFSESLNKYGYNFIPSYRYRKQDNTTRLEEWKNLLHLHIPKCAGTSFEHTLNTMYHMITWGNSSLHECQNITKSQFIQHGNITNKNYECVKKILTKSKSSAYKGLFIVAHCLPWRPLLDEARRLTDSNVKVVCPLRDPYSRLYSYIKMITFDCTSEAQAKTLIEKDSDNIFNLMSKYIYNLTTHESHAKTILNDRHKKSMDKGIIFLDIHDNTSLNAVKSAHLSACNLPNIIQPQRLNTKRCRKYNLSENYIQKIYEESLSRNACFVDSQLNIEDLTSSSKHEIHSIQDHNSNELHPLTFIMYENAKYIIVETKLLIENQGKLIDQIHSYSS